MISDLLTGICYGLYYLKNRLFHSYVLIPLGILIELAILYGLNQLIKRIGIKFPASVLGMLLNLIWLCLLKFLLKYVDFCQKLSTRYLKLVEPSMNFSLKWINVFFIPSFIMLPLSKPITIIEVLKIAAVFSIGWCCLMVINVYSIMVLRLIINRKAPKKDSIELLDITSILSSTNDIHSIREIETNDLGTVTPMTVDDPFITRPEPLYVKSGISLPSIISDSNLQTKREQQQQQPQIKPPEYPHLSKLTQNCVLFITTYIDWILYGFLLITSIPLYYIPRYHVFLPFHLSITILCYFVALMIPSKWPFLKKFAHPILISTMFILFICFISLLIYHHHPRGFLDDLQYYKTGKTYLNLFNGKSMINNGQINKTSNNNYTKYPIWPGCGDVLGSLMDISIISLSLPMFTHRKDFIDNFWIMIPILFSMALTFFIYPIVCFHIGISSTRSIGFIGRSVTLALGTPLITALEGSVSLMAVCTILSGICGVLIGDYVFKLLKIPKDDFVVRGVSLGINCGAIATAHLLTSDPRAASMSSLSFSIFGTVMIIFASIGLVRQVIHTLVQL